MPYSRSFAITTSRIKNYLIFFCIFQEITSVNKKKNHQIPPYTFSETHPPPLSYEFIKNNDVELSSNVLDIIRRSGTPAPSPYCFEPERISKLSFFEHQFLEFKNPKKVDFKRAQSCLSTNQTCDYKQIGVCLIFRIQTIWN